MPSCFFHRLNSFGQSNRSDLIIAYLSDLTGIEDAQRDLAKKLADCLSDGYPDQVIIFIPDHGFDSFGSFADASEPLNTALARLEKKTSVFLCSFSLNGRIKRTVVLGDVVDGQETPALDLLQSHRPVITSLFRQHNGFIHSSDSFHFSLPSGKHHVDRFVRISRLLTDTAEINYLASSLLPFAKEALSSVYVDTPALFPLVASLSDLLRGFVGQRPALTGENFRSYAGYQAASFRPNSLVIISCSSKAGLADLVRNEATDATVVHFLWLGGPQDRYVAVCDLQVDGISNPQGLVSLPELHDHDRCPMCDRGSFPIHLAGDHFELPTPQPKPVNPIQTNATSDLAPCMGRYATSGVFKLGLGENWSVNPREFYVDPVALAKSAPFQGRLNYILDNFIPASSATVVYMNDRSKVLADLIVDRFRDIKRVLSRDELSSLTPEDTKSAVIVVSMVVESGRSLNDVTRDLRRFFPKASHCFLVGLVKYKSLEGLNTLRNSLTKTNAIAPHRFANVEQILLPSSSNRTAWDVEKNHLKEDKFIESFDLDTDRTFWRERLESLMNRATPLARDLFVPNSTGLKLDFTPGFIFWPDISFAEEDVQASVYFSISSVLQNLRNIADEGKGHGLRNDVFQQSVIDPKAFMRFNDGLIQAALLRSARQSELNYAKDEFLSSEIARCMARIFSRCSTYRGSAAAEFLLAILTNRLSLRLSDFQKVLEQLDIAASSRIKTLAHLALQTLKRD